MPETADNPTEATRDEAPTRPVGRTRRSLNPLFVLVTSGLVASGAILAMHALAAAINALPTRERVYVSGDFGVGAAVIALDTSRALPVAVMLTMVPLAVIAAVALAVLLTTSVRLWPTREKRTRRAGTASAEKPEPPAGSD